LTNLQYGLCFFTELKPPQILANCSENRKAYFSWILPSEQVLSPNYLKRSRDGWFLSGNCTYQNNTGIYVLVSTFSK